MTRVRGRHAAVPRLGADDRLLLAEMAVDAIDLRLATVAQPCAACDDSPDLLCPRHAAEVDQAGRYRRLARSLGADI